MSRVRTAVVLLALAQVAAHAQDWRDDDSIWNFCGIGGPHRAGPRLPDPPPIIPTDWIAIPVTSDEPALLALPWIIDPTRAAPKLGENGWTAKLASPLAAAACAFATIVVDADEVRMARLTGARWLVVDDSAHIGDPERRGDRGVPIALKQGANRLFVVDASEGWELELWKPPTRCVIGTWDIIWPDPTESDETIEYPVFNASLRALDGLHVHYGHLFAPSAAHPNRLEEWGCGGAIAPLALLRRGHIWWSMRKGELANSGRGGNRTPVAVHANGDPEAAREILCDLDASYERKRHGRLQRELGRKALAGRAQARIPWDAVLVYGTHGSAGENGALLARARLDQQVLWYACDQVPLLVADDVYLGTAQGREPAHAAWVRNEILRKPIVLYGSEQANSAWAEFAALPLSISAERDELPPWSASLREPGVAATIAWASARGMNAIPPEPTASLVSFASGNVAGARLSLALGMLAAQDGLVRVDSTSSSGFRSVPAMRK